MTKEFQPFKTLRNPFQMMPYDAVLYSLSVSQHFRRRGVNENGVHSAVQQCAILIFGLYVIWAMKKTLVGWVI